MMALAYWLRAAPTLCCILLLGSGLTLLLWRGRRISMGELLAWSWLAGTGVGSIILGALSLALGGWTLFAALAVLSLAVAAAGWLTAGRPLSIGAWPALGAPWEKALLLVPLALIGLAFWDTFEHGLLADGLFMMEFKARIGFENGGQIPGEFFTDRSRAHWHPRYPLFLSLSELWLYLGAGKADQTLARTLFPPFYAAAALLLYSTVARMTGRLWAGAVAVALSAGVPPLLLSSFTLDHGYADYPLAVMFFAAVCAVIDRDGPGQKPLAALAGGLLPWIKDEGILLWGIFALGVFVFYGWKRWRDAIWIAAPGLGVWLLWRVVLIVLRVPAEETFHPIGPGTFSLAAARFEPVIGYFAGELTDSGAWGYLWIAVPVALVWGWKTPLRPALLLTAGLALAPLCLYLAPYLFTRLDLGFHLRTSCDRLVLHSAWVALLTLGLAIGVPRGARDGE
jgi:hypothetical protein